MTSSTKNQIYVEGPFFINESLAHVNRNLVTELDKLMPGSLAINPLEAQSNEMLVRSWPQLQGLINTKMPANNKILLRHLWPPFFLKPAAQKLILIQPWELSSIPQAWVEPFTTVVDELWVPSYFVKNIFVQNGVTEEKIKVIPNGVNPEIFKPEGPVPRLPLTARTIFLFVGGTIPRKGIDILLQAWEQTFTPADDVLLLIKDMGKAGAYRNQNAASTISELQKKENVAPILYMDSDFSEEQMAQLYRLSSCLVAPYRGEGFCLPALEAAACGTAVIATQGGPTDDFCQNFSDLSVTARTVQVKVGEPFVATPHWFEPNLEDLCAKLKQVVTNNEVIKERAIEHAADLGARWSWQKAAQKAASRLE